MKSRLLITFLAAAAAVLAAAAQPKVVAHRGYWDAPGAAQNSIRALVKADSVGCYAAEFDVWMTADGVLVVNHDGDINGIHIESSPSDAVLAQTLANGEHVPTLAAYLEQAKQLPIRLVLELKPHDSRNHERRAIQEIIKMVAEYGLTDRTDYITFSKYGFDDLITFSPDGTAVYYLSGDYIPQQIKAMGGAGIDYAIWDLRKHPEWIAQAHDLGLEVNIWTVNTPADMQWCIAQGADYITTNAPELLQSLLQSQE